MRVLVLTVLILLIPTTASAHYVSSCKHRHCKIHVLRPYRSWFLAPVGACESGTDGNLRHGLRAINPTGTYRGRYQFDFASWGGAGGYGDPVNAVWYEQAYRAVIWLHRAGKEAWPICSRYMK